MKSGPLALRIAERLRRDLDRERGPVLPTLRELARRHGVSLVTLSKAMDLLREEGLVDYRHGRRIRIVGRRVPQPPVVPSQTERVYNLIFRHIVEGGYVWGTRLPKREALALTHGVSKTTVSRVLRRLECEGVLHRRAKSWVVGRSPAAAARVSAHEPGVIVVLQHTRALWRSLCAEQRTASFGTQFHHEADTLGVQVLPVVADTERRGDSWVLAGSREILDHIVSLRGRYLGALIVATSTSLPDLPRWFVDLARFRRPVVWFDRHGEDVDYRFDLGLFTRCRYRESLPAIHAVEYLAGLGHRSIGYHYRLRAEDSDWAVARGETIAETGQGLDPPVRVVPIHAGERILDIIEKDPAAGEAFADDVMKLLEGDSPLARGLEAYRRVAPGLRGEMETCLRGVPRSDRRAQIMAITRCHTLGGGQVPVDYPEYRLHTFLARHIPEYVQLLREPDVTAIVNAQDFSARDLLLGLRAAGIDVPRQMSFLSFDNSVHSREFPFSSVDFGFGFLGYCAFHAIMNDIPLPRDRDGNIYVKPRIAHRGTIGPPRTGPGVIVPCKACPLTLY